MKLNQELIKRLAAGEIAYKHTGNKKQFHYLMTSVLGKNVSDPKNFKDPFFVRPDYPNIWLYYIGREATKHPNLPIYTTEQFFEVETEKFTIQCDPNEKPYGSDKAQSVIDDTLLNQTMDKETRKLAKQLFVAKMYAGNLPSANAMKQAIDNAKQFIQLLNNE